MTSQTCYWNYKTKRTNSYSKSLSTSGSASMYEIWYRNRLGTHNLKYTWKLWNLKLQNLGGGLGCFLQRVNEKLRTSRRFAAFRAIWNLFSFFIHLNLRKIMLLEIEWYNFWKIWRRNERIRVGWKNLCENCISWPLRIELSSETVYATKFHPDVLWPQCKDNVK